MSRPCTDSLLLDSERDAVGIATLTFDKPGAAVNTLSAQALVELNVALDTLTAAPPKALVIRSGKASGFIAGADVEEFRTVANADAAVAIVRRGWDTFNRLASVPFPTLALIRGFCLGGGLELALACRYRVAVDVPSTRLGLPEVLLGIVPGWGGIRRLPRWLAVRPHWISCSPAARSMRVPPGAWASLTKPYRNGSWRTRYGGC